MKNMVRDALASKGIMFGDVHGPIPKCYRKVANALAKQVARGERKVEYLQGDMIEPKLRKN